MIKDKLGYVKQKMIQRDTTKALFAGSATPLSHKIKELPFQKSTILASTVEDELKNNYCPSDLKR